MLANEYILEFYVRKVQKMRNLGNVYIVPLCYKQNRCAEETLHHPQIFVYDYYSQRLMRLFSAMGNSNDKERLQQSV